MNKPLLDHIMHVMFWLCLGFLIVSLGITAAHYKWGPTVLYQDIITSVEKLMNEKESTKKKSLPKLSNAETQNTTPEKTYAGYTLITKDDDTISLIDMDGKAVRGWKMPFGKLNYDTGKESTGMRAAPIFAYAHLQHDGSVLGIYHAKNTNGRPVYGLGLVKLDSESNLVWHYDGNVHDGLYEAKDGRIYALIQTSTRAEDVPGLAYARPPALMDGIVILNANGDEEKTIDIYQAFIKSRFSQMLYSSGNSMRYTYTSSIDVLEKDKAALFPMFKEGDILLAITNLDAIAVIRPSTGELVWASRNVWRRPFDARFMDNGRIMLYDSEGYYDGTEVHKGRVMQFNPATQGFDWVYVEKDRAGENLKPDGTQRQLPNGNILATQRDSGLIRELTPDQEVVWQFSYPGHIGSAERVSYDFLDKAFWVGAQ